MTLDSLAWLFTLGVAAHNLEEALGIPAWSRAAGRWHRPVSAPEFTVAVVVLTGLLVLLAAGAVSSGPRSPWAYAFSGYVATMVANAAVPHLAATLAGRRYMPGTATAVVLNVPLGAWYLHQAAAQDVIRWPTLAWVAPLVAVSIVAAIPMLFAAGRRLHARGAATPRA